MSLLVIILVILSAAVGLLYLYKRTKLPLFPTTTVKSFLERSRQGPIAHRGTKPENTLAGIRRAKQLGASAVEVDVLFTKDGHPVLVHDDTVDRTSDGYGKVEEMTLRALKELDVGSKFGSEFAGERIPTLQEAVHLCDELDLQLYLEFKGSALSEAKQAAETVKRLFAENSQLYSKVAVISFWPQVVYAVRRADPSVVCGLSLEHGLLVDYPNVTEWWKHFFFHRPVDLLYWFVNTWLCWRLLGVSLLTSDKKDIFSGRFDVSKWKNRGVHVITWTVNSEEEQRHFRDVLRIPYMTDNVQI